MVLDNWRQAIGALHSTQSTASVAATVGEIAVLTSVIGTECLCNG